MQGKRSPSAARRQLGARLRQLRSQSKLTGAQVGAQIGCTHATISKIENGNTVPDLTQLDRLLDLYQVTDAEDRTLFRQLLDDASGDGWWEAYDDVLPHKFGTYLGMEVDAESINAYESTLVHGLLETRDYASALLHSVRLNQFPEEIERLVDVRMRRKELLTADQPLQLSVVMEEAVIRRPLGGPEVMRAQLEYLLEAQQMPNVSIQILPFSVGAHPGLNGSLTVLEFPDEPAIGYTEGPSGNNYLTKPREISRCKLILSKLREAALSPEESSALIAQVAKEMK